MEIVGSIIAGKHGSILIRQKSGAEVELGDLLLVKQKNASLLLQVYDVVFGSQIPEKHLEMISGMKLEGYGADLDFMDPALRNYVLAQVKAVARVEANKVRIPKTLPPFMGNVRHVTKDDLTFLAKPPHPVYLGKVRSGSKALDVDVNLSGLHVFKHHIVVPATTGRGKSNLVKVILWSILDEDDFGVLVLDPHDEYYGRHGKGLKDHPESGRGLLYYSSTPPSGANTLVVNLRSIMPWHFQGIVYFSDAQGDAIRLHYNRALERNESWIENIVRGVELEGVGLRTLQVLRRKFDTVLGVYLDDEGNLQCRNRIFSASAGTTTTRDIADSLEAGKTVIVDTSRLLDQAELLIGSIVVGEVFHRYQRYKSTGMLDEKPVVSIVIEEAPRVLGADVLASSGENIYSTVAREGRKFKVGLVAITQLTSLIPRPILANMNTKIILGNEMALERKAIIDSAAQDLSDDSRTIASLDIGEAIVSSNFTKFAVPVQIPLFEEYVKTYLEDARGATRQEVRRSFQGVDVE